VKLETRKLGTLEQAAKVIALCLPPVVMSLIGLAALSRKKHRAPAVAGEQSRGPGPATQRIGAG
jgi:hypothetical protein